MNNSFVITFLCYFTGIINSFFFTTISYWWFFHTLTIFWNVWFPVHARNFKISGYTKYLHFAIILITLTLSTIPVGAALGTGGYVISVHPPSLNYCFLGIQMLCFMLSSFPSALFPQLESQSTSSLSGSSWLLGNKVIMEIRHM